MVHVVETKTKERKRVVGYCPPCSIPQQYTGDVLTTSRYSSQTVTTQETSGVENYAILALNETRGNNNVSLGCSAETVVNFHLVENPVLVGFHVKYLRANIGKECVVLATKCCGI